MKKALHNPDEAYFCLKGGRLEQRFFSIEDVLAAINGGESKSADEAVVYDEIRGWMAKYLEHGVSDSFMNELNSAMKPMQFERFIVPGDLLSVSVDSPQCLYVPNFDLRYSLKTIAAYDFSKLITGRNLKKLKQCKSPKCDNFFLGPPQAKWCSKTCGSKFRVRDKRKRDL